MAATRQDAWPALRVARCAFAHTPPTIRFAAWRLAAAGHGWAGHRWIRLIASAHKKTTPLLGVPRSGGVVVGSTLSRPNFVRRRVSRTGRGSTTTKIPCRPLPVYPSSILFAEFHTTPTEQIPPKTLRGAWAPLGGPRCGSRGARAGPRPGTARPEQSRGRESALPPLVPRRPTAAAVPLQPRSHAWPGPDP